MAQKLKRGVKGFNFDTSNFHKQGRRSSTLRPCKNSFGYLLFSLQFCNLSIETSHARLVRHSIPTMTASVPTRKASPRILVTRSANRLQEMKQDGLINQTFVVEKTTAARNHEVTRAIVFWHMSFCSTMKYFTRAPRFMVVTRETFCRWAFCNNKPSEWLFFRERLQKRYF